MGEAEAGRDILLLNPATLWSVHMFDPASPSSHHNLHTHVLPLTADPHTPSWLTSTDFSQEGALAQSGLC